MKKLILSVDQSTSGTKAVIYNDKGETLVKNTVPLDSVYPRPGFVEQSPLDILTGCYQAVRESVLKLEAEGRFSRNDVATSAITNQRESFLLWDSSGKPLTPVVSWQCKRSIEICSELEKAGAGPMLKQKTGLPIDPYFSASKLKQLLRDNISLRDRTDIHFGTIDSWLLFNLTEEKCFATDYTNASRTQLFNINTLDWDDELLTLFGAEGVMLPDVQASNERFGFSDFGGLFDLKIPIDAMIGDSHAAAFGEQCFTAGSTKVTMGTGSSILMNCGKTPVFSDSGAATTICYSTKEEISYAMEGIIVSCGSLINWLKDQINIISSSDEANDLAATLTSSDGVFFIPALSGLGAPFWKMNAKGSFRGLGFHSDKRHMVRAVLESIAFQVTAILKAMENDLNGISPKKDSSVLKIDGGVSRSSLIVKMIASLTGTEIDVVENPDGSPLGAALLAGLGSGIYSSLDEVKLLNFSHLSYKPIENKPLSANYVEWERIIRNL